MGRKIKSNLIDFLKAAVGNQKLMSKFTRILGKSDIQKDSISKYLVDISAQWVWGKAFTSEHP